MNPETKSNENLKVGTVILVPMPHQLYGLCRIVMIKPINNAFSGPAAKFYLVATSPWVGREDELDLESPEARALHDGHGHNHVWTWIYPTPLPRRFKAAGEIHPSKEEASLDWKKMLNILEAGTAMLSWESFRESMRAEVYDDYKTRQLMKEKTANARIAGRAVRNEPSPPMFMGGFPELHRCEYSFINGVVHSGEKALRKADCETFTIFSPEWGMDKNCVWTGDSVRTTIHRPSFIHGDINNCA